MVRHPPSRFADFTAIGLSGLCLIHCVGAMLLFGVAALASGLVHGLLFAFALPLAAWALWRGFRQHHHRQILHLGGAGLMLMLAGLVLHGQGVVEAVATACGVLLLGLAHWRNLQACQGS